MDIQITNRQKRHKISLRKTKRTARTILSALGHPDAELSLVLVDDLQIAALNSEFLDRSGPTNVIAFPMREGAFAGLNPDLLGDVVISAETAQHEAAAAGLELEERLTQLLVHGILHLCGYDHENDPAEARRMNKKSRQLLKAITGHEKGLDRR